MFLFNVKQPISKEGACEQAWGASFDFLSPLSSLSHYLVDRHFFSRRHLVEDIWVYSEIWKEVFLVSFLKTLGLYSLESV